MKSELLSEHGAKCLVPVGLGDNDQCMKDDFATWRELLWPELNLLLRDEDDISVVSSLRTTAIIEYKSQFYSSARVAYTGA